jgi:hypothetical protein
MFFALVILIIYADFQSSGAGGLALAALRVQLGSCAPYGHPRSHLRFDLRTPRNAHHHFQSHFFA